MAIQAMGYTKSGVDAKPEILLIAEYAALPITLDSTAFTNGVCKAGTPIATNGTVFTAASGQSVLGILLWDVPIERPQGTGVIAGIINKTVAQAHSGVTYSADVMAALKNVEFR